MGQTRDEELEALRKSLDRIGAALGPGPVGNERSRPPPSGLNTPRVGQTGLLLAVAVAVVAVSTGHPGLLVAAGVLAVISGAWMIQAVGEWVVSSLPAGLVRRDPGRPHIGMGATVAGNAELAPGATVEMGATVDGARLERGAVVRMGATVSKGAVLEKNAVVSWGADVGRGAVIGRGARVGAGATVSAGARVPPGTWVMPGSTWSAKATGQERPPPASVPDDPRIARIDAACDRLEAGLREAPASVREFLGTSVQNLKGLRDTCHALLRRERALREESSADGLAFLDRERASLERRRSETTDETARRSLEGALAAIDQQKRERSLLGRSAERIDAELTRLVWTLEGMAAQLVRVRSVGAEDATGVLGSVGQLHDEIDAIADALEEVAGTGVAPRVRSR